MKILLLIPSLGSGGAERQLVNLALLFKQEKHNVEFVVYHKDDFYKHILDSYSIKINKLNPKNNLDRILKIRNFIRKSNCDVVISFLETANFLSCCAAINGKDWKIITTELSSKKSTFLSKRGKVFTWFQRYSDAIVCNSYNAKNMWEINCPAYSSKLSVIYNPVILPAVKSEYIINKNGKLNIVVAASYQYLKNPIGLIKALALMGDELRDKIEINWYGRVEVTDGDAKAFNESLNLIKNNNLENVIFLNEATKDIENKMYEADAIALFSELEGLPNAICEGMVLGKPIIMTRVSDYRVLVDETNGFLCDWDNPESIKNALEQMMFLTDIELLELGKSSKAKAKNLFSSKKIVQQWVDLMV